MNYFSVIIPTLNEEDDLPFLLSDLSAQKNINFETIIVDANSKDKTEEKAMVYKKKLILNFIKVRKANLSYQRNYGAQVATGRYLVFLDADSRIGPDFIHTVHTAIEQKKGLAFLTNVVPDSRDIINRFLYKIGNLVIKYSQVFSIPFSSVGSFIIDRNLFLLIGGYDTTLFISEDHDIVKKINRFGVRAKFLNTATVIYNLRRERKEGWLKTMVKLIYGLIYLLIKKEIKHKIFQYDKGGAPYKKFKPQKLRESENGLRIGH